MKRIYRPHSEWEEFAAGMWRVVNGDEKDGYIIAAAGLMKAPEKFKAAMLLAVERWPNSCEVNLTAKSMNRRAWLGHAGCCLGVNSPENCTRLGWHTLTRREQGIANRMADQAIRVWEQKYERTIQA